MPNNWRQWADRHDIDPQQLKKDLSLEWVVAVAAGIHLEEAGDGRSKGLCPFHPDTDPSLDIYANGDRWGCFSCGRGGDHYDFIGEYWELEHFESKLQKALELKERFDAESDDWKSVIKKAAPVNPPTLAELGQEVQTALNIAEKDTVKPIRDLLTRKGLDIPVDWLKRNWRLGVNAQGEVIAPYWSQDGTLTGYKRRKPGSIWIARKGVKLVSMYGEWQVAGAQAEAPIWICEGETDTWLASYLLRGRGIALGLPSGAASHIKDEWVDLMRDKRITLVMDADKAGRMAAERWWEQLHTVCKEVAITFPESDLVESKDPLRVLESGRVRTLTAGYITETPDQRAYRKVGAQGPGPIISNFTFQPTKHIEYRDTLGEAALEGWEGHFADQVNKTVRITTQDLQDAARMRRWAGAHGRSWYDSAPKHVQALQDMLQAQTPFLKEEIAVPVAGLWGEDTGHSVFVLPDAAGGSIGSAIGKERWSFADSFAKYDIGARYSLGAAQAHVDLDVLRALHKLHQPAVITPLIAWFTTAPLRKLFENYPPLAVLGGSESGKTTLTLALQRLFYGWGGAEQNLSPGTTAYAIRMASAAANGLPMWWDEYRRGASRAAFEAAGQLVRDSWTASVSSRGGMGDDLSRIEVTQAIAPLVLSGEAGLEEKSLRDRAIVVRLPIAGRNSDALDVVMRDVAGGGGALGRALIEWLLEGLDREDAFLWAVPLKRDRKEQGLAVLRWGWEIWRRFLLDVFDIELSWELDLSIVTTEREIADETPEITALVDMLEQGTKWRNDDKAPVAWIESYQEDVVCVRAQAFYNAATRDGYVLPGGPTATVQVLRDRFPSIGDRTYFYDAFGRSQQRAERLTGFLSYMRSEGVEFEVDDQDTIKANQSHLS